MSPKKLAVLVLGVGVLVGVVVGQPPVMEKQGIMDPSVPVVRKEQAYLTVTLPPSIWTTVTNPRAAQGEVFYITDIFTEGQMAFYLPPEFNGTGNSQFLRTQDELYDDSFVTPVPLATSMQVYRIYAEARTIVFAGYYSTAQPVIEELVIEP